jgi:hypothetical protein
MRLKALTRIQQIVLQIGQQEESLGGLLQPTLIKLVDPLNNQFGDLRSQIIREVTRLIVLIAQISQMMQQEDTVDIVEQCLTKLFSKGGLLKLLSSAKNVMADYAH